MTDRKGNIRDSEVIELARPWVISYGHRGRYQYWLPRLWIWIKVDAILWFRLHEWRKHVKAVSSNRGQHKHPCCCLQPHVSFPIIPPTSVKGDTWHQRQKGPPRWQNVRRGSSSPEVVINKTYQDADRMPVCMPYWILTGKIILLNMQLHVITVILMNSGHCGFREVICTNGSLIDHI